MTQLPPSTLTHEHTNPEAGRSLADRFRTGEEFAVTFGGQGADWFATLRDLVSEDPDTSRLGHLVDEKNSSYMECESYAEWFAIEHGYRASGGGLARRPQQKVRRRHHVK